MDVSLIPWDYVAIAWGVLAVATAVIAKMKDRRMFRWFLYGAVLAPIAVLHALRVRPDEIRYEPIPVPSFIGTRLASAAEPDQRTTPSQDEYHARLSAGWPVKAASEPPVTATPEAASASSAPIPSAPAPAPAA